MTTAIRDDLYTRARGRLDDLRRLQEVGLVPKSGDFAPSVHYPPITMYPPITEEELFKDYTLPEDGLMDVYAHIPFCEKRCIFCHYPVKLGEQAAEKDRYLTALEKEMDLYMRRLGVDKIYARSILIGGGTPTFLSIPQLTRFLQYFTKRVDLGKCKQFNYDVDPGSLVGPVGLERLKIMRDFGVDRLTIGVQSLNEDILKIMHRPHDAKTALESIENSVKAGYQVNIEFIFGHPGETLENWVEVMEQAVRIGVPEIQLYRLKIAPYGDFNGVVNRLKSTRPELIPGVEDTIMMKQMAIDILAEHGYHENLRRVFTKQRKYFSHYAHNQCCQLYDQIGLGLTAFSSMRNRFGLNTQYFEEYYKMIEEGKLPVNRGYVRNAEEQIRWAIILPIKNRDVRKKRFEQVTGRPFEGVFRTKIELLKKHGLVEEDEMSLGCTTLGAFFADDVAEQFNANQFQPFKAEEYFDGPLHPYKNNAVEA